MRPKAKGLIPWNPMSLHDGQIHEHIQMFHIRLKTKNWDRVVNFIYVKISSKLAHIR